MTTKKPIKRDLVYPELSYQIVGILFEIFNKMGYGYQEKYYQKAISEKLREAGLPFREQVFIEIKLGDSKIGRYFLDFLIDDKVVLEIKKLDKFLKTNIDQTYAYLKSTNLKLGILANFTKNGIQFKRIVN